MKNIKITIKKEMRAIIRDKKSLLMMALTPIFIPIFVILMAYIYDFMMTKEETIYNIGINYNLTDIEKELINKNNLQEIYYNSLEKMEEAYKNKEIIAYITKEGNKYTVYNNSESEDGSYSGMYITSYLENYNTYLGQVYLSENNIDLNNVYNNISYEVIELEGSSIMATQVINMAIVFTIMAMTLTAIYSATDLTAGEKERGTLETLLTYPIKSSELILGKYLAIVTSTIITLIISIALAVISLNFVKDNFSILQNITLNLNTSTISLTFIILFTYSLFISGLCIMIASFAKTFKEAQSTLTPVSLIICVPMFLEMLGIKLTKSLSLIPILSHNFILNDIFSGTINNTNIIIVILSSIIYSIILIYIIIKEYKSEKILFNCK
ncbi:MAG: ABC transporter permease [Bacilli bacterium]|nr:ABC transporter permease [Bacilli bacterium]